jgi:ABC-type glycerol-3-phosphate transport system substrate-binding protein
VIKALTGPEGQAQFAKRGLAQPARISVAKSGAFAEDTSAPKNKKMLNEAIQYAVFSPFHPKWREIEEKYIRPKLDLIFNGKKTAVEAAQELVPEVNAQLQQSE